MYSEGHQFRKIGKWARGFLLAFLIFWALVVLLLALFGTVGEGADSQWTLFLGRFHPLILHLPIGALSVVAFIELGRLLTFGKWVPDVRPALGLAALSAIVSVGSGFLLGQGSGYRQDLLNEHFWWGCGFGVFLCLAFVARLGRSRWSAASYRILLALSLISMTMAGHHGASLTHGENYLTDQAPPVVRDWLGLEEREPTAAELAALEAEKPVDEQIFYIGYVRPILELKCYECHNADKRKGKLRMDTIEDLLIGGKEGPALVKGSSAESEMIRRIELPEYDEHHMPPEGHVPVTDHELEILKAWIDTGATDSATVADLGIDQNLLKQGPQEEVPTVRPEKAKMLPKEELQALQAELRSLSEKYPGALSLVSRGGDALNFNASVLKDFGPNGLEDLSNFTGRLIELNLSAAQLSEADFEQIAGMSSLRSLVLNGAEFDEAWLQHLSGMEKL